MISVILEETKKMARNPGRLLMVFHLRRWRQFFSVLRFNARGGGRWQPVSGETRLRQRQYSSYEEYVRHQQSKFQHLDLADYDRDYRRQLGERLKNLSALKKGTNVLCLGARQGTEVKTFHDLGCFAVGVDLNPGADNPYVLRGDFHHLQFPPASADVIFTNSLDHAFDLEKLVGEISRVLKPGGLLVIEAIRGDEEKIAPDHYASLWWKKTDDLVAVLASRHFQPVQRALFSEPWPGEQICFVFKP